jgi:hypothetical protein
MTDLDTLKEFARWLAGWAFFGWLIASGIAGYLNASPYGRDSSDEPGWFGKRSNVKPITDQLTSCQYLLSEKGGITPRLDKYGRHICTKGTAP